MGYSSWSLPTWEQVSKGLEVLVQLSWGAIYHDLQEEVQCSVVKCQALGTLLPAPSGMAYQSCKHC